MASFLGTGASNPGDVYTNGKLGVGVSSPSNPIDVSGRCLIRGLSNGGGGFWSSDSDDPTNAVSFIGRGNDTENQVGIFSNSAWRMVIKDSGRVGVGTASPGDLLDVGGKVLISDSTAPGAPVPGAVVIYFDGTNLKAKRNDGKVSTLSDTWG